METKILIANNDRETIKSISDSLKSEGYKVYSANTGLEILEATHDIKPDAVLMDVIMPGLDGFEVCKQLKMRNKVKDIPVIMITEKTDRNDIKKAFDLGAFDYIKKPADEVEVVARVQSALRFKRYQDKLKDMATKDGLTGLYNHALLIELFEKEYEKKKRKPGNISFCMIDIDFFKKVNDTYGHMAGDIVLKNTAEILTNLLRRSDIVGRYGGEEFSLVLPDLDYDDVKKLCERIRSKVEAATFLIGEKSIKITISIGICFKSANVEIDSKTMMTEADNALYKAKNNGRNRVEIYCYK